MIYLLLAICCSTFISIGMRLSTGKVSSSLGMLAVNYLVCTICGAFYADFQAVSVHGEGLGLTGGLSVINGCLLLGGFLMTQVSISKNGVVPSNMFMRLGLLVPMLVSVVLFRESPTWLQVIGFCVAVGAIILFNMKKGDTQSRFGIELIFLPILCGGSDAMLKVFERVGPAVHSDLFLCLSFGVSFVLCALVVAGKKEKLDRNTWVYGGAIGVANFFSSKMLMGALTQLPVVVVFPTFSVTAMLIVTSCGVVFFKEKLEKHQWLAYGAIIAALVMLNI